jgi:hypothetical protein
MTTKKVLGLRTSRRPNRRVQPWSERKGCSVVAVHRVGWSATPIGWAGNATRKAPAISGGALRSNEPSGGQEIGHPHNRNRVASVLSVLWHARRTGPNVALLDNEIHARALVDLKLAF